MNTPIRVLLATFFAFLSVLSYAQAPVPFINLPLAPDATAPGGPQFTLTVNGTGFVSSSVVNWNGNALATQFVSSSQLTAVVPAANVATASTGWVTVVTPAPGGGKSNVAFFTATVSTPTVGFVLASSPAEVYPSALAVGDFNGDGYLDLAVANEVGTEGGNTVSVLLGDGKGNFTLASTPTVGNWPAAMVTGDFNGDGKLDLATANQNGDRNLSILLGDGTGNFTLVSSPAPGNPTALAMGDFNGDGNLDLAVAVTPNSVTILLGDGTGNFTPTSYPLVGTLPWSVAVGDFNGDGKLDLATANYGDGTVSILLGDGTGNFTLASSPTVGASPTSIAVGDFNGDGKLDLATANLESGTVSVLLGDGTGNFTLASSPSAGSSPQSLVAGDFNGDGRLDLAVANQLGTVSILLGDGKGNFTLASSPAAAGGIWSVVAGDFSGNGQLDLVTANLWASSVSILMGVPQVPAVMLSPTNLAFGTQLFGTSGNPQPVTLTNLGSAPLDITKGVTSANFSQTSNCPRKLAPGGTCTVNVVFTPRNINTITGTLTITDNAPNSPQTVSLSGVGYAVTPLPSTLDFGNQSVGTSSQPQTVTLTNYASKAATISGGQFSGTNPGSFGLQNTTCHNSLPGGASCTINIVFAPKGTGYKVATLEVTDNGGASPQTVVLSGTGTN